MRVGRMVAVSAVVALSVSPCGHAQAQTSPQNGPGGDARPSAGPSTTSPSPAPKARKLKLGPFADPYARIDEAMLAELLRFEQHIEVHGVAPKDLDASMAEWWAHFDFDYAIYGRGYNVQKPTHPGAINILPLIDWVKKKIKESRQNKASDE